MLYVRLTDAQRTELRGASRRSVGRVALRAQMVLLSGRGYAVPQIAAIHECGEDVVRLWLHRYEQRGVAGLQDEPKSGRPPKDPLARRIVDAQAGQPPECSGHVQACWTVALLTAFLAARFCLRLSRSTVRRCLHATGWRWARPRLAPASARRSKRDPDAEPKLAAIARAAAAAAAGAAHLLYLDECDLQLLPVVRAMWMKGPRVRVPTPGTNARRAFFGALDAATGRFHRAAFARKLAVHFVAFLEQLAAAYPSGRLVLVLAGGPPARPGPVAAPLRRPRRQPGRADLGPDEGRRRRRPAGRQHRRADRRRAPLLRPARAPSGAPPGAGPPARQAPRLPPDRRLIPVPLFWLRA
jgi:transposase